MAKGDVLWFLLAIVASVRTGFALTNVAWVACSRGWCRTGCCRASHFDLEYWAVASRIYDVRQAKRLFGLIGTGEVIARIVGAFSVPLLVGWFGVAELDAAARRSRSRSAFVLLGAVLRSGRRVRGSAAATEARRYQRGSARRPARDRDEPVPREW